MFHKCDALIARNIEVNESKDMDTSDERLVKQLRSIKNLLALGVVGLFCLVGASIYYIVDDVRENKEQRLGRTFYEQADTLARNESYDELLALSQERQKTHPRDFNGFFFAGIAHLNREEYDQSIEAFNKAVAIRPTARKAAQAWLDVIKEKRKQKATRP
jgi:tetratricopeptide (TPR) repeat protein